MNDRILNEIDATSDTDRDITAVIAIGINDSILEEDGNRVSRGNFRENLEGIVEKCREETDQVILVGLTPVDESRSDPLPEPTSEVEIVNWLGRFRGEKKAKAEFGVAERFEPGEDVADLNGNYEGRIIYSSNLEEESSGISISETARREEEIELEVTIPETGTINGMLDALYEAETPEHYNSFGCPEVRIKSDAVRWSDSADEFFGFQEELPDNAELSIVGRETDIILTYDEGWTGEIHPDASTYEAIGRSVSQRGAENWYQQGGEEILEALEPEPVEIENAEPLMEAGQ